MEPIFDIGFVTAHFGVTNLKHYLDLLKNATDFELRYFRTQVRAHRKTNKEHGAFAEVPKLSTHQAVIGAINHELLKRSWRYKVFKKFLPIRKGFFKFFRGIELTEHEYFGVLYCEGRNKRSVWHVTKSLKTLKNFWLEHWKFIVGSAIALAASLLKLLGKV